MVATSGGDWHTRASCVFSTLLSQGVALPPAGRAFSLFPCIYHTHNPSDTTVVSFDARYVAPVAPVPAHPVTNITGGRPHDSLGHRDRPLRWGGSGRGHPRTATSRGLEDPEGGRLFAGGGTHVRRGRGCAGSERERGGARRRGVVAEEGRGRRG